MIITALSISLKGIIFLWITLSYIWNILIQVNTGKFYISDWLIFPFHVLISFSRGLLKLLKNIHWAKE